ncbi:hypothetical protein A4R40_17415 [Photorhabdus laumondii subsp. laumondii]|nr:hypothetical protein A4R40_17415 [Photorhabdus laumondii subsp. laumondii]
MYTDVIFRILITGIGAIICMDIWTLIQRRLLGIPSLDYALVGRWFLWMRKQRFFHQTIANRIVCWLDKFICPISDYAASIRIRSGCVKNSAPHEITSNEPIDSHFLWTRALFHSKNYEPGNIIAIPDVFTFFMCIKDISVEIIIESIINHLIPLTTSKRINKIVRRLIL